MADVFISYAREDQARVEPIVRGLEAAGISVWWDRQIPGGADFVIDTEKELTDAAVCVACWAVHSVGSRWVRDEASAAAEQGKLIPVQLDGERPPLGLRQYQCLDLAAWNGDPAAPAFAALVEAVRRRINKAPAEAAAAEGSIAVLPFANLSGDTTCQNFCDAVGADIISLLAKNRDLNVLARGSSFARRGGGDSVAEIGRRLNVRYVIDGTIRRSANTARITCDLVLSSTGQLLWNGQSEGKLDDIFALQDDMARYLAGVVAPELARFEREAAARKNPDTLTPWECAQRGSWHLFQLTSAALEKAESWFGRAISIDPAFAHGHAGLANAYVHLAFFGPRANRALMIEAALKSSAEAVNLSPDDAYCRFVHSRALAINNDLDGAIAEGDAAIALNPSSSHALYAKGFALACRRATACEGVETLDRAIAMNPADPLSAVMHCMKAFACLFCGDLVGAEAAARCSVRQHNATFWSFATLTATLGLKGDAIGAAAVLRQLLEKEPGYTRAAFADDCFFIRDEAFIGHYCEGLRAAGLP